MWKVFKHIWKISWKSLCVQGEYNKFRVVWSTRNSLRKRREYFNLIRIHGKYFSAFGEYPQKKNIAVFTLFAKSLKSLKIRPQAFSPFTHLYVLRRTLVTKAEMYCGKDRAAYVGTPLPHVLSLYFLHPWPRRFVSEAKWKSVNSSSHGKQKTTTCRRPMITAG